MSISDSIQPARSGVTLGLDDFGSDITGGAKKAVSTVVDTPETTGSPLADSSKHAAVEALRLRADFVRFRLEESMPGTIAGAAAAGAKPAAPTSVSAIAPVSDIPKGARGLKFSETKSASILAYKAQKDEEYEFPGGKKWRVVDVSEDKATGFRAIALKPTDPTDKRTIVAFAGTDDLIDVKPI